MTWRHRLLEVGATALVAGMGLAACTSEPQPDQAQGLDGVEDSAAAAPSMMATDAAAMITGLTPPSTCDGLEPAVTLGQRLGLTLEAQPRQGDTPHDSYAFEQLVQQRGTAHQPNTIVCTYTVTQDAAVTDSILGVQISVSQDGDARRALEAYYGDSPGFQDGPVAGAREVAYTGVAGGFAVALVGTGDYASISVNLQNVATVPTVQQLDDALAAVLRQTAATGTS